MSFESAENMPGEGLLGLGCEVMELHHLIFSHLSIVSGSNVLSHQIAWVDASVIIDQTCCVIAKYRPTLIDLVQSAVPTT